MPENLFNKANYDAVCIEHASTTVEITVKKARNYPNTFQRDSEFELSVEWTS